MIQELRLISHKLDHMLGVIYAGKETMLSSDDISLFHDIILNFERDINGDTMLNGGFDYAVTTRFIINRIETKEQISNWYSRNETQFDSKVSYLTPKVQEFYNTLRTNIQNRLNEKSGLEQARLDQYKDDLSWMIKKKLCTFNIFKIDYSGHLDNFVSDLFSNVDRVF